MTRPTEPTETTPATQGTEATQPTVGPRTASELTTDELDALCAAFAGAAEVDATWWLRTQGSAPGSTATVAWVRVGYAQKQRYNFDTETWEDADWVNYGYTLRCLTCTTATEAGAAGRGCAHTAAALAVRAIEIRTEAAAEFPEDTDALLPSVKRAAQVTQWLHDRASTGEFVGQHRDTSLYLNTVADILDWGPGPRFAGEVLEHLRVKKLLGLNGNILIPFQDEEDAYAYLLSTTGHRRLNVSDFGWWSCQACERRGDDWTNPSDQPCEPLPTNTPTDTPADTPTGNQDETDEAHLAADGPATTKENTP